MAPRFEPLLSAVFLFHGPEAQAGRMLAAPVWLYVNMGTYEYYICIHYIVYVYIYICCVSDSDVQRQTRTPM